MEPNAAECVRFQPRRKQRPIDNGKKLDEMAKNRRTENLDHQIDENLRRAYSETLNEPLPERFTQLLDQLRQQTSDKTKASSEDEE